MMQLVANLGDPTSYLEIGEGVPVLSADGEEVGTLEHVLADEESDIFDGIIIRSRTGPGGWRFADASQIAEMYERGIVLSVDADGAAALPEPSENPPAISAHPDDLTPDTAADKLRRAWDYLSGNY